jgi:hypothetical protein
MCFGKTDRTPVAQLIGYSSEIGSELSRVVIKLHHRT